MAGPSDEVPLVTAVAPAPLRALEARVAGDPSDLAARRELAQVYLDARQPGMALGLVEAQRGSADDVRVWHIYARALLEEGRSEQALAVEKDVLEACHVLVFGHFGRTGCDSALFASAVRRVSIWGELVARGVRDPEEQPEATFAAYQNATREARVALP
jgi:hypothetical protein